MPKSGEYKYNLSKDFLYKKYVRRKLSQEDIARMIGCSQWVINHRLKRFNIEIRDKTRELTRELIRGITKTDLAYVAGLFDGEGSYVIAKHFAKNEHCGKRGWVWELRMTIGMTDFVGLEFLKRKFNKKRLRITATGKRKFYHLTFYSNEIRAFLPSMLPYIQVKKRQARLLLKALSIIKPKSDPEIDKKLESMYLKMKKLNNSRYQPI